MTIPAAVAVVGSGIMGPGIAATMARAGAHVRVFDISEQALETARTAYARALAVAATIDGERDTAEPVFTTELEAALDGVGLVIEAVPERIEIKRDVLGKIEAAVGADVIVATNTSGIPITDMAASMQSPNRFVGMHWSNPPHLIPMIEVIPGEQTDQSVVDQMVQIVRDIGYEPVVEREIAGFVENRVLYAIMRECVALVEAGIISQQDLDTCVKWGIGYKLAVVGPMRLLDMAGLDTYSNVSSYLNAQLDRSEGVPAMISALTDEGRLGFKSGAGIFDYADGEVDATRQKIVAGLVDVRKVLSTIERV
jgi:3-hydroxyacyl-CoA dehydrogenase